jgi:succinate-acetate transporter protein
VTRNRADAGFGPHGWAPGAWGEGSRIVLTPVAAPSILGLYGMFSAALLYGSNLAGWWGTATSPVLIFPFLLMLGGLAQLIGCIWAYRARDALATAMHGVWATFWLAFGLYQWLVATGNLPLATAVSRPAAFDLGMWFVPLVAITGALAVAAAAASVGLVGVLTLLTGASLFAAIGYTGHHPVSNTIAGWLFVLAAAVAWYVASALLIESERGRAVLPTGRRRAREAAGPDQPEPAARLG